MVEVYLRHGGGWGGGGGNCGKDKDACMNVGLCERQGGSDRGRELERKYVGCGIGIAYCILCLFLFLSPLGYCL